MKFIKWIRKKYLLWKYKRKSFCVLEDVVDKVLTDKFKSSDFFEKVFDTKNLTVIDAKIFFANKNKNKV